MAYLILVRWAEIPIAEDSDSIWEALIKEAGSVLSHLHELLKDSRSGVELFKKCEACSGHSHSLVGVGVGTPCHTRRIDRVEEVGHREAWHSTRYPESAR